MSTVRYSIWNPTGNITALVESDVEIERQPLVAARLMERHAEVEQVGFVRQGGHTELRMAGGEFCGNASMCAAGWYAWSNGWARESIGVTLEVSGAEQLVEVRLSPASPDIGASFCTSIHMPQVIGIETVRLRVADMEDVVPVVRMQGISHVVVKESSVFTTIRTCPQVAEHAVRTWCTQLKMDGLGLMFLQGEGSVRRLTPLVFVPGSDTVYWEHSCASGSAAVGNYVASQSDAPCDLLLEEPGGCLRVQCDKKGVTWLYGHTNLMHTYESNDYVQFLSQIDNGIAREVAR